jgi:hypothetical protein
MFRLRFRRAVLGWESVRTNLVSRCPTRELERRSEKIGLPPECFVTEHRLDLGFLRGETEPKRIAGGWNLTE